MATDGRTDRLTDVKANVSGAEPEIVSGNEFFGMRLFMIRSNSQSLLEKGSNGDLTQYRLENTIKIFDTGLPAYSDTALVRVTLRLQ